MHGINIKGILLATLAVLGIDLVTETVLMNTFGPSLANATDAQVLAAVEALYRNTHYLTWALLLGTASTIVGGYLAARLAQRLPYFNALAFGVLYAVLGIAIGAIVPIPPPSWLRVVLPPLTVAAALAGAYLYKRTTASSPPDD